MGYQFTGSIGNNTSLDAAVSLDISLPWLASHESVWRMQIHVQSKRVKKMVW